MKNIVTTSLVVFMATYFFGCASVKFNPQNLQGTFTSRGNHNTKIVIAGNSFTYIDLTQSGHLASPCCDTLAIGDFEIDRRGFLVINSPDWLNDIFVDIVVNEKNTTNNDSVTFIITNPIETGTTKTNSSKSELEYSLLVQPKSGSLNYFRENNQVFDRNTITFFNPEKLSIDNFSILVKPKSSIFLKNLAVRELNSLEYHVKNSSSNIFEIEIPKLTYGYLSYKRMNGEFAKVIDNNTISWQGKEFIRSKK